jgi:hypothetical protein
MTFLIGVLAFVQMTTLPGALATYGFRLWRIAPLIPVVFAVSLTMNYVLVVTLVLLGLYTANILYFIIFLETCAFVYVSYERGILAVPIFGKLIFPACRKAAEFCADRFRNHPLEAALEFSIVGLALGVISLRIVSAFAHAGEGLDSWDAIQSFNRWAVDWANGRFAYNTWHYPQLLSTNWSMSYVLTGRTDLTVFASSLARFFMPALLISLLWYAFRVRCLWLAASVPLCDFLFQSLFGGIQFTSYADVPVAFFVSLSAWVLLANLPADAQPEDNQRKIILSAVLAFGAASTKQAGLFWVVSYCVLLTAAVVREQETSSARFVLSALAALIFASALWYLFIEYKIVIGQEGSELSYAANEIYGGVGPLQRAQEAFLRLDMRVWLIMAAALLSSVVPRYRQLLLLCTVPYFAIWAFFFSYDNRNAAVALPFLSVGAVIGCVSFGQRSARLWISFGRRSARLWIRAASVPLYAYLVAGFCFLVAAAWAANAHYSLSRLFERQYLYEAKNLFGSVEAPNGLAIVNVLSQRDLPVKVWSADRYTCLLTIVRSRGSCTKLNNADEFRSAMLSAKSENEEAILLFVAPIEMRAPIAETAVSRSIRVIETAGRYDVWSNISRADDEKVHAAE